MIVNLSRAALLRVIPFAVFMALLAVAVGLVVFALWISLDAPWMRVGEPTAGFVPIDARGQPM